MEGTVKNVTRTTTYYVMDDDHNVVPTKDPLVWGQYMQDLAKKRIARTQLPNCWVSTVLVGLDMDCSELTGNPPVIFETMAFKGQMDDMPIGEEIESDRYCTYAEAMAGHAAIVARLGTSKANP